MPKNKAREIKRQPGIANGSTLGGRDEGSKGQVERQKENASDRERDLNALKLDSWMGHISAIK